MACMRLDEEMECYVLISNVATDFVIHQCFTRVKFKSIPFDSDFVH